jgi:hypothetical protein
MSALGIAGNNLDDLFKPFRARLAGQAAPAPSVPTGPAPTKIVEWRKGLFGGYPVYGPDMSASSQQAQQSAELNQQGNFNSLISGAMDAATSDTTRLQGAADEQYNKLSGAAADYKGFLNGIEGKIQAGADAATGTLKSAGDRLLGMGEDVVSNFNRRADGTLTDLDSRLGKVGQYADDAIATAKDYGGRAIAAASGAVAGFDSGFHAQIADSTATIERRALNDQKQWEAMAASGQYSHSEIDAARRKSQFDTTQQVGSVKAQLGMQYETTRASLGMALAGVTQKAGEDIVQAQEFAASTGQASAALRANVSTALTGQGLEAERLKQGYAQMFTGLASQTASIQSAASLAAVQAMMSGNQTYYEMVKGNPRSVVSMLAGFMQIAQLATSPGGPAAFSSGGGGGFSGGGFSGGGNGGGGRNMGSSLRGDNGPSPIGAGGNSLNNGYSPNRFSDPNYGRGEADQYDWETGQPMYG